MGISYLQLEDGGKEIELMDGMDRRAFMMAGGSLLAAGATVRKRRCRGRRRARLEDGWFRRSQCIV